MWLITNRLLKNTPLNGSNSVTKKVIRPSEDYKINEDPDGSKCTNTPVKVMNNYGLRFNR